MTTTGTAPPTDRTGPRLTGDKPIAKAIGKCDKTLRRRLARGVLAGIVFKAGPAPKSPLTVFRADLPKLRELAAGKAV